MYKEIETSAEVVAVIWAKHRKELIVFESYTDPDGTCPMGNGMPKAETAWGISGSSDPLFRTVHTWETGEDWYTKTKEKVVHTLCVPMNEEE